MSLYGKYRPQTFADVVGQDHIVTTLENAVQQDKLAHAYLFAGSRGTGKTSIARILAKHILTAGITDETLRRQIEKGVVDGSIVDLIEIDGASNRRIEDSRDLVEKIQFSPVVARAKVYIIDEVHMLTREAFNALLKTLEEPPAYAFFILATTELQKIPPTIQSRCQRFAFHQIRDEDLVRRLQYIADQEHITVDRMALRAIARHAQGGMRDAISLLDQLRSLEKITLEDVQERVGTSGQEHVDTLFEALDSGKREEVIRIVQDIEQTGMPLDVFVRQLLADLRTRLHTSIEANEPVDRLIRMMDALLVAVRDLRIAPLPGLVLESALLSLCEINNDPAKKELIKPSKKTAQASQQQASQPAADASGAEKHKKTNATEHVTADVAEHAKEKAVESSLLEAPDLTLAAVQALWPSIVQQATPAALKMSLKNGRVTGVTAKGITLTFGSIFHKERVRQNDAIRSVEQLLQQQFKRPVRLECTAEEERGVTPLADTNLVDMAEAVGEIF
ncbi:MAG: DNA polymerase III subunit gamma/tau [Candidatus Peribacteraceae bacterium]|nr:DNA polymerase III subunit gamma/tau [Candidatus Peribacteraceae bacterium]